MPFAEIFYHIVMGIAEGNKPLDDITSKLVETKLCEESDRLGGKSVAVGMMPDHVHILLASPPEGSPDAIITELRETTTELVAGMGRDEKLDWKHDYGVVSVSRSHLDIVKSYIDEQKQRHMDGKTNATLEKMD